MQIYESGAVGHGIDVAPLAQVPRQRSHITDFENRFETDLPLDAEREVVDGGGMGAPLKRAQRRGPFQRSADEVGKIVNRAEINRHGALKGWIAGRRATVRSAADAREVENAAMRAQHSLVVS